MGVEIFVVRMLFVLASKRKMGLAKDSNILYTAFHEGLILECSFCMTTQLNRVLCPMIVPSGTIR